MNPRAFAAGLVLLAELWHEPNMGWPDTSHKTTLVPHSKVKGPH